MYMNMLQIYDKYFMNIGKISDGSVKSHVSLIS